ncbi:glycosyltransferase [Candidatus Omnitrophota bacterium]
MTEQAPKVSIIIPSTDGYRDGNVPRLMDAIKRQDFKGIEIVVVKGVSPGSEARNEGARRAKGRFLVFIDDDVKIDRDDLITNLVKTLEEDPKIGMAGAPMVVPEDATFFQKRTIEECSWAYSPVIDKTRDSDLVCHACQAIPRRLYLELGGENPELLRGEDAEFHNRMREAGYRIVLAANTGVYHPPYRDLPALVKERFMSGFLGARDQVYYPHLIFEYGSGYTKEFRRKYAFSIRIMRFIFNRIIFSVLRLRFIRLIFYVSYGAGRISGLLVFGFKRYVIQKKP